MRTTEVVLIALGLTAFSAAAHLPPPPAVGGVHLRGTVQSFRGGTLVVSSSSGPVKVQIAPSVMVLSVVPSSRSKVKAGSFLGIASVPGVGGAQRAEEVVVFPEAARGSGEGSYDWDLPGGGAKASKSTSRMTNGTVSSSHMTNGTVSKSRMTNGTVKGAGTSEVTLEFKSGSGRKSQKISLPQGIPFVTFEPGARNQLTPGAHVVIFCHNSAKGMVADRVLVGKNGLVPPM
jgi:hypothetical protein